MGWRGDNESSAAGNDPVAQMRGQWLLLKGESVGERIRNHIRGHILPAASENGISGWRVPAAYRCTCCYFLEFIVSSTFRAGTLSEPLKPTI